MPRRSRPVKRVIAPDPVYQSESIAKFVNVVMSRGKRSTAERVVYDALSRASKQAKKEPLEVFESALRNADSNTSSGSFFDCLLARESAS